MGLGSWVRYAIRQVRLSVQTTKQAFGREWTTDESRGEISTRQRKGRRKERHRRLIEGSKFQSRSSPEEQVRHGRWWFQGFSLSLLPPDTTNTTTHNNNHCYRTLQEKNRGEHSFNFQPELPPSNPCPQVSGSEEPSSRPQHEPRPRPLRNGDESGLHYKPLQHALLQHLRVRGMVPAGAAHRSGDLLPFSGAGLAGAMPVVQAVLTTESLPIAYSPFRLGADLASCLAG